MGLTIVPVTKENRAAAEQLEVFPRQRGFIETVAECMQEADALELWHPVCILLDGTPVGFSMYGLFQENHREKLWFDRLLIDRRFQGRGWGTRAIQILLAQMRREYPGHDIYLSVYDSNRDAIGLYKRFGFEFNGELDINGEKVMILKDGTPLPV